jgi:hypothetical protein
MCVFIVLCCSQQQQRWGLRAVQVPCKVCSNHAVLVAAPGVKGCAGALHSVLYCSQQQQRD